MEGGIIIGASLSEHHCLCKGGKGEIIGREEVVVGRRGLPRREGVEGRGGGGGGGVIIKKARVRSKLDKFILMGWGGGGGGGCTEAEGEGQLTVQE